MKKGAHSHVNPDPLAVSLQVAPFSHGFGEQGDSERSNPNRRNKTNNIQDSDQESLSRMWNNY